MFRFVISEIESVCVNQWVGDSESKLVSLSQLLLVNESELVNVNNWVSVSKCESLSVNNVIAYQWESVSVKQQFWVSECESLDLTVTESILAVFTLLLCAFVSAAHKGIVYKCENYISVFVSGFDCSILK